MLTIKVLSCLNDFGLNYKFTSCNIIPEKTEGESLVFSIFLCNYSLAFPQKKNDFYIGKTVTIETMIRRLIVKYVSNPFFFISQKSYELKNIVYLRIVEKIGCGFYPFLLKRITEKPGFLCYSS